MVRLCASKASLVPRDLINWPFAQRALALTRRAYDPGVHCARGLVDPCNPQTHASPNTDTSFLGLKLAVVIAMQRRKAKPSRRGRALIDSGLHFDSW